MGGVTAAFDRAWSSLRRASDPDQARALLVLVLPGVWVAVVLALEFLVPSWVELTPLLAAAPAIACAGTGRKQCVRMAALCALFALLPLRSADGAATGLGQRIGTCGAILGVALAGYVISHRRLEVLRELEKARTAAESAQRLVFRRPRPLIGGLQVAVGCATATSGGALGGELYEVLDTPFGVRAILGEVRGSAGAPDTVACASVLLGSFRESAYDEPDLRDVVHRLELSLSRHLGHEHPAYSITHQYAGSMALPTTATPDAADPWQLSDVLTRPRSAAPALAGESAGVLLITIRPDGLLEVLNRGHQPPHLFRSGKVSVLDVGLALPPLGAGALEPGDLDARQALVVPFRPGDAVLLATDSVTAARDRAGNAFPLTDALRAAAHVEPAELVTRICTAVVAHTRGRPTADLALLSLRKPAEAALA